MFTMRVFHPRGFVASRTNLTYHSQRQDSATLLSSAYLQYQSRARDISPFAIDSTRVIRLLKKNGTLLARYEVIKNTALYMQYGLEDAVVSTCKRPV
jgi:hypothetical protein